MFGDLSFHLARQIIDDRLREADDRRLPIREPAATSRKEAHERTRALVRDSLLLSRRAAPPGDRRWA